MMTEPFNTPGVRIGSLSFGIRYDAAELAALIRRERPLTPMERSEVQAAIRTLTQIVGAEQMEAA